jgi:hypothetical protein
MKRLCRRLRVRERALLWTLRELSPHFTIITDPTRLARLKAEVGRGPRRRKSSTLHHSIAGC